MNREPAKTFRDLIVWQKAHALALRVYRTTAGFPKHELFGLVSQMRRAAVSVAANIVEGFSKRSRTDKARFMNTAQGSLEELRYYCILAADLGYAPEERAWEGLDDTARLLGAYARSLRLPPNS